MQLFKPSDLHQFLNEIGAHAKKSLSQNFLIDGNILRKIILNADIQSDDLVLEIGPGPGALTQMLLEAKATVIAVEKDTAFAKSLTRLQTPKHTLEVFEDDILQFPLEAEIKKRLTAGKKAKVVANLPYHLTTPILAKILPLSTLFSTLTIMVQDEVARRFVGKPGSSDYSSFTVFLNFYSRPEYSFFVSKHCFYPQPKVNSAIVKLNLTTPPAVDSEENFFKLTRRSFEHRRKMLRSSLKPLYRPESVMKALAELGLNPEARPEVLSLQDFLNLYSKLNQN